MPSGIRLSNKVGGRAVDSGGPVYDCYLPGGVRAVGIIIGLVLDISPVKPCYYFPWQAVTLRLGSASGNLQIDVG